MAVPYKTEKKVFPISSNFCNLFLLPDIYSGKRKTCFERELRNGFYFLTVLNVNRGVNFNKVVNLTFINKEFILSKEMNTEPFGSDIGSILRNFLVVAVTLERFVKKEFSGHDHRERGLFYAINTRLLLYPNSATPFLSLKVIKEQPLCFLK